MGAETSDAATPPTPGVAADVEAAPVPGADAAAPDAAPAIASPRLRALAAVLAVEGAAGLAAFWEELAAARTPLVEPHPTRADARLLTFVYRATGPVANIVLNHDLLPAELADRHLTRLGETDLWYLTLPVRDDLRGAYAFSLNDPLTEPADDAEYLRRTRQWVTDPLNPAVEAAAPSPYAPAFESPAQSLVTLPAAAAQPWFGPRPDVPAGSVSHHRVASRLLGNERDIWLYLPPGAAAGDPLPVLVYCDGLAAVGPLAVPATLDNLIADGLLPPLAALLVGNVERNRELPCHQPFANFLGDELLPWARARHPLTTDPARTIAGGLSYGGLAAAFCGLVRPDVFGNVLSQSGSYWWKPDPRNTIQAVIAGDTPGYGWLPGEYARRPRVAVRFYLDVGRLEYHAGPWHRGPSMVDSNRWLRDVLIAKGYDVTYAEFGAGHSHLGWRGTVADGLRALLGR